MKLLLVNHGSPQVIIHTQQLCLVPCTQMGCAIYFFLIIVDLNVTWGIYLQKIGVLLQVQVTKLHISPPSPPLHDQFRDQNGFRPKSLKARNAELGGLCTFLLNEFQMKHPLSRGVWGAFPQKCFGLWGRKWSIPVPFGSLYSNTPTPSPSKHFLFRFTLISRMVLAVGKKSEIRLKSENFDPCNYCALSFHSHQL